MYCLQKAHFRFRDTYRPKVIGWKKIFHEIGNQSKLEWQFSLQTTLDFKIMNITRHKEGHHILIKESIQEEDATIVNIYTPNIGTPQNIR